MTLWGRAKSPKFMVVIAKFESFSSFSELLHMSEDDYTPAAGSVSTPGTIESP